MKVVAVFPEATPYRTPLFDLIATRPEIDLVVVYASQTVMGRTWKGQFLQGGRVLRGPRVPGARRLLRHDYPITPGILGVLRREHPNCVLVSGWSTFASQAAVLWCRARGVPYLLVSESHDRDPRSAWRRFVKGAVVPWIVRGAAGVLVTGTAARESMVRWGAPPERISIFANTVDVAAFGARVAELRSRRDELRSALGLGNEDVVALSVARLAAEKGLDTFVESVSRTKMDIAAVIVGDGPERPALSALATRCDVRLRLVGELPWDRIAEAYAIADVFVLLSRHEPWGVVVNEAAAAGLPLILSTHVGAAYDLLVPGENGFIVAADDVEAATDALHMLAADAELRARFGACSLARAAQWGYGPSVDALVDLVGQVHAT